VVFTGPTFASAMAPRPGPASVERAARAESSGASAGKERERRPIHTAEGGQGVGGYRAGFSFAMSQ
jgi:hypothetical protein